jgi:hypothetical protein
MLIAAICSLFAFVAVIPNEVQGFTQYVKVNIENADYSLDGATLLLTNYDTDYRKRISLTDSTTGSTVFIDNSMPRTSSGDRLQACLFTGDSPRYMVCDSTNAIATSKYLNFYVDMAESRPISR